jgi:hypothetical protein
MEDDDNSARTSGFARLLKAALFIGSAAGWRRSPTRRSHVLGSQQLLASPPSHSSAGVGGRMRVSSACCGAAT